MSHEDPARLLGDVRNVLEAADTEGRELTPVECARCDALLDAAEALSRLAHLEAGHPDAAALSAWGSDHRRRTLVLPTVFALGMKAPGPRRAIPREDLRALLARMRAAT